jgi:hypothetical protein
LTVDTKNLLKNSSLSGFGDTPDTPGVAKWMKKATGF